MGGIDDVRINSMVLKWTEPDGTEFIFYGSALLHWELQITEGVIPPDNPFWFDPIKGAIPQDPTTIPPKEAYDPSKDNYDVVNTATGKIVHRNRPIKFRFFNEKELSNDPTIEQYGFNAFNHNKQFRDRVKDAIKQKHKRARLKKFSGGLSTYEKN